MQRWNFGGVEICRMHCRQQAPYMRTPFRSNISVRLAEGRSRQARRLLVFTLSLDPSEGYGNADGKPHWLNPPPVVAPFPPMMDSAESRSPHGPENSGLCVGALALVPPYRLRSGLPY